MSDKSLPTIVTHSADETRALGERLAARITEPAFIGLSGDLGAGKTVFAQGFARGLGVAQHVVSPTFQLLREYAGRLPMFHFDFYRLDTLADLAALDFEDYLRRGVVVAEWAERFDLPGVEPFVRLRFTWVDEDTREIVCEGASPALAQTVRASF
jgi:tRNA threonylcarbamoyladenosine biosynthesis protein TsaE